MQSDAPTGRIVEVALRHPKDNGNIVISADPPNRHCDLIRYVDEQLRVDPMEFEQGFVDDRGEYLSRTEAAKRVLEIGQKPSLPHAELFSEDLW